MPLELTLRESISLPLSVDSIRLETVRTQSLDEVRATRIVQGNRQPELGDFFDVKGSASDDNTLVWKGDCARVKLIAARLSAGTVRVEGNAGMHLGAEMTGGEVIVSGDVADWAGAEMKGGSIHVCGNAGNLLGAVYRGGRRGMTGGEILVDGNAGHEVGQKMRRGLIAIGGNVGDAVGFSMIAGTILVFGDAGLRHGAGMRRGTIGLFGSSHSPDILPTFRSAGAMTPLFLRLYLDHLRERGFPLPADDLGEMTLQRYAGDRVERGLGEIFTRSFAV